MGMNKKNLKGECMKKVWIWFVIAVFLATMPATLLAKEKIMENELEAITAQEGVTIEFGGTSYPTTHFSILGNFGPELQSWGDSDGCTTCNGYTAAGWFGAKNMSMDPFGSYIGGGLGPQGSFIALYNKMDIDVGSSGSMTRTIIGLPSALVHPANITQTIAMGTTRNLNDGQQNLGTMYTSEFALLVNPTMTGCISIGTHATGGEGVEIGFSGTHPFMAPALGAYPQGVIVSIPGKPIIQSWGDADGFSVNGVDYLDPGYVGAKGLTMADGYVFATAVWPTNYLNILISGTMTVDVGTNSSGDTGVVIGVPKINILPGSSITQPIALGNIRDFSDNQALLGRAYIGGINISPSGSIAISAH